jgi:glycerol-3-phosphate acyltransferase PlsX
MKDARERMKAVGDLNYIGYVEGRGVFDGEADVVITNGVVGNVMIKLAEGLSAGIFKSLKREVMRTDPELGARLEPVIKAIYAKHDYHEYGGAPLLGVNGICIICHGSSVARTITNAILKTRLFVEARVNEAISQRLGVMEQVVASELSR